MQESFQTFLGKTTSTKKIEMNDLILSTGFYVTHCKLISQHISELKAKTVSITSEDPQHQIVQNRLSHRHRIGVEKVDPDPDVGVRGL